MVMAFCRVRCSELNAKKGKVTEYLPREWLSPGHPARTARRRSDHHTPRISPRWEACKWPQKLSATRGRPFSSAKPRAWSAAGSVRDSLIYALPGHQRRHSRYLRVPLPVLPPQGQLITSILILAVWVSFLVIAYTGLIVTIPRAGGDYVWIRPRSSAAASAS